MKKLIFCFCFFIQSLIFTNALFAQEKVLFKFNHQKDDASSYVSIVEEDVFYNGYLSHHSQIVNRISSIIHDVDKDGTAQVTANYMTTEDSVSNFSKTALSWGTENTSNFKRKSDGELIISDSLFMPTVRNVPLFPKYEVGIGETWTAKGKEVHDMRSYFNMTEPLIIPFEAKYKYVGNTNINNKNLCVIDVDYEFFFQNTKDKIAKGSLFLATAGYSKQRLYWDKENGILNHYTEEFRIKMSDVYNNLVEFRGVSKAEITQAKFSNSKKNVEKLQKTVENLKLKDVNIKEGSKGLTISIENIQFEPDSAVLLDSEKKKLDLIATLLQDFSNDILITGHCAERGSESARQVLSEQRAESVASYLKQLGVRDAYHIFSQGKGSTEPIASNATEEGRQKNRRVEIIVLN